MVLHCFDPRERNVWIAHSSPKGWTEHTVARACFPDAPSKGFFQAAITSHLEALGYQRDHDTDYEALKGNPLPEHLQFSLFRGNLGFRRPAYFVITRSDDAFYPDVSLALHVPQKPGWLTSWKLKHLLKNARYRIPSGWLQPFVAHSDKDSIFRGDDAYDEMLMVSRSLQTYLYSGGRGILPDKLDKLFSSDWMPRDLSIYELIEEGPTREICSDRPVVRCTRPIKGIYFGCTAANRILPLSAAGPSDASDVTSPIGTSNTGIAMKKS